MKNRQDYFKQYYKKHKSKLIKSALKYHRKYRKKLLISKRNYYRINREDILAKNKMKGLTFKGHAYSIWRCINKYAKQWDLPISTFQELWDWTNDDPTYLSLFDEWVTSGYAESYSPVLMRSVKKKGWEDKENLKWDKKQNYSWWNEDSVVFKEVSARLEDQQKERNQRSKEWRKKVRDDWKAKRKKKENAE